MIGWCFEVCGTGVVEWTLVRCKVEKRDIVGLSSAVGAQQSSRPNSRPIHATAAGPPEGCHGMDVDEELTKKCSVEIMVNAPERRDLSLCGLQEEDAVM